MPIELFVAVAVIVVATIAVTVLAVKLSNARRERDKLKREVDYSNEDLADYRKLVAELTDELLGHRARADQVRLGALRASAASAEARKAKAASKTA